MTHFDKHFTFDGCGPELREGARCELSFIGIGKNPVKVTSISDHGFAFLSLDGHFEGKDRNITFQIERGNSDNPDAIVLTVSAWGPASGASSLPAANKPFTWAIWASFAAELNRRVERVPRTYLASDNFSLRGKRSVEDMNRLDSNTPLFTVEEFQKLLKEDPEGLWDQIKGSGPGDAAGPSASRAVTPSVTKTPLRPIATPASAEQPTLAIDESSADTRADSDAASIEPTPEDDLPRRDGASALQEIVMNRDGEG
ncbi:hypothetical protein [Corynebacterium sp. 13CS0277]|uniref:hypothetical protein n=1 Tax=Corynebacterium sp. 13CS0277 TaxID=2071994 RepID=UPI001E58155D|nr:hypothetical protein [Corynebacterium sp. 13CS0277]